MRAWLLVALAGCGSPEPVDPHAGHGLPAAPSANEHAGHGGATSPAEAPDVVEVDPADTVALGILTAPARPGTAVLTGRAPAVVTYDPTDQTRVSLTPGGQIRRLYVPRPGEVVQGGAKMAEVFTPEVLAAFGELLVARDLGEPWLDAARQRLARLGVSPRQVGEVLAKGVAPETWAVFAPRTGVVRELGAVEGAWLAPGATLALLADPDSLLAELTLTGPGPSAGSPLTLRDPATGRSWTGSVALSLPTADVAGYRLRVVPDGDTPIGRPLVAEWGVAVRGLWVPRGAVVDTGTRRVVFVETAPGRFEPRDVVVGARTADEIEIVRGLTEGEEVVVAGTFLLDSETQIGAGGHAGHGG